MEEFELFFYFLTGQIRDLINQYLIEANSGQYDYVKALAEFSSKDESALTFKKGEIIAVVPKHDAYTEKVSTLKPRYNEPGYSEFCDTSSHFEDFLSILHLI